MQKKVFNKNEADNYFVNRDKNYNEKIKKLLDTLPDYVRDFAFDTSLYTTVSTRFVYVSDIAAFLNYVCNASDDNSISSEMEVSCDILNSLDKEFILAYLTACKDIDAGANTNTTLRRKLSSIKSLYNYLYDKKLLINNAPARVKLPKDSQKPVTRLTKTEMNEFIDAIIEGPSSVHQKAYHNKNMTRDMAIMILLLHSGLRISECVGLNISDLNLKSCEVHTQRKGEKIRDVQFSDEACEYLKEYLQIREKIEAQPGHEAALFLSLQRKRISVRTVEELVKKYNLQAGTGKKISPHKLRSTFGTLIYEETGDLDLVRALLGHSSITTTSKHYVDVDKERKQKVRNILSE